MVQRPDSTNVAGYRAWQSMGRQVRKGEKGIVILAPIVIAIRAPGQSRASPSIATGTIGTPAWRAKWATPFLSGQRRRPRE